MNIRLQVEYLVIEEIMGLDFVEEQLKIVVGQLLIFLQKDIIYYGYVIEVWIYVEDLVIFYLLFGIIFFFFVLWYLLVRYECVVEKGSIVFLFYDLMIVKMIVMVKMRK